MVETATASVYGFDAVLFIELKLRRDLARMRSSWKSSREWMSSGSHVVVGAVGLGGEGGSSNFCMCSPSIARDSFLVYWTGASRSLSQTQATSGDGGCICALHSHAFCDAKEITRWERAKLGSGGVGDSASARRRHSTAIVEGTSHELRTSSSRAAPPV